MTVTLIRALLIYFTVILAMRIMGKRQIGELEPTELVLTMLISDLAAVPMQDFGIPLLNGVVPIVTLLALSMLLSYGCMRSIRLRRLVCGSPTTLIKDGILQQAAMRANRFTLDELIEALRSQGVTDLTTVKYAILETDGQLSVLLYPAELLKRLLAQLAAALAHGDLHDEDIAQQHRQQGDEQDGNKYPVPKRALYPAFHPAAPPFQRLSISPRPVLAAARS